MNTLSSTKIILLYANEQITASKLILPTATEVLEINGLNLVNATSTTAPSQGKNKLWTPSEGSSIKMLLEVTKKHAKAA